MATSKKGSQKKSKPAARKRSKKASRRIRPTRSLETILVCAVGVHHSGRGVDSDLPCEKQSGFPIHGSGSGDLCLHSPDCSSSRLSPQVDSCSNFDTRRFNNHPCKNVLQLLT